MRQTGSRNDDDSRLTLTCSSNFLDVDILWLSQICGIWRRRSHAFFSSDPRKRADGVDVQSHVSIFNCGIAESSWNRRSSCYRSFTVGDVAPHLPTYFEQYGRKEPTGPDHIPTHIRWGVRRRPTSR